MKMQFEIKNGLKSVKDCIECERLREDTNTLALRCYECYVKSGDAKKEKERRAAW